MCHFDALPHPTKKNRMIADDIPCTDRLNADLAFFPFSDETFSGIDAYLIEIAIHRIRQDFRNLERRAARRIFLRR